MSIGNRQIESFGLGTRRWGDFYHRSMTISWPVFVLDAFIAFLALNILFATIYWFGGAPISNVHAGAFADYVYFSIETIASVGYGDMHPQTAFGHIVASIETFVGLFAVALMTGLIFARFSRPRARILFADKMVVGRQDGHKMLMVRVANARHNNISDASARLWLSLTRTTREGRSFRGFHELPLVRRESPLFILTWTLLHIIDKNSPLYGMNHEQLEMMEANFILSISGTDETAVQTVRARRVYDLHQVFWGHQYVDLLENSPDDRLRINYTKFHETERDASAVDPSATDVPREQD